MRLDLDLVPYQDAKCELTKLSKECKTNEIITIETYNYLHCTNGNAPTFYNLSKLHKQKYPASLILYLLKTIEKKNVCKAKHHIRNSWDFKKNFYEIHIPNYLLIISLDIVSMYINISCSLILNSMDKR